MASADSSGRDGSWLQRFVADVTWQIFHGWGRIQASRIRGRWQKIRNPRATIRYGGWCYFGPGFRIEAPMGGTFICGDHNHFRLGFVAELARHGSRIEIGNDCHFTYESVIQCGTNIHIEDRCIFGQSSIVFDDAHRFRDLTKPMLEQGYEHRTVRIHHDVFTTTKCTIMADIGAHTVVGANSVVSRPLPPGVLAVGAPARVVEDLDQAGTSSDGPK